MGGFYPLEKKTTQQLFMLMDSSYNIPKYLILQVSEGCFRKVNIFYLLNNATNLSKLT